MVVRNSFTVLKLADVGGDVLVEMEKDMNPDKEPVVEGVKEGEPPDNAWII